MKQKRILAISSAGGHWVQLRRLRPAWQSGCQVTYVTTNAEYRKEVEGDPLLEVACPPKFKTIIPATRWQKIRLIWQLFSVAWLIVCLRPDVIISTGAAPGYFALRFGKLIGARTIWIDSIANAAELSLSGKKVGKYADLWLTQWEHLAVETSEGPKYKGAVI